VLFRSASPTSSPEPPRAMGDEVEDGEEEDHEEKEDEDDGIDVDTVIIIDNGSGLCKAGLSTDELPSVVFPEVVGRPRPAHRGSLERDAYFGDECTSRLDQLAVNYPLQNGIIESIDDMQDLWEYIFFEKLKANPTRHPVLLTEPPYNPKPTREKMAEGVLALLGQGRTTGLVLDSGEGVTHTIPIFDGYGLSHCINRIDVAGREINTLLAKFLAIEGHSLTKTKDQQYIRDMKEKHCYVALDPSTEVAEEVRYRLPDGREITLGDERWKAPEALFKPSMVGIEAESCAGVASMVWDSVSRCEIDLRRNLLSNVVLSGGSTMFPGFQERLHKELRLYAPTASQAGIRVVPSGGHQNYAVWIGAQVFASLKEMQQDQWITLEDWYEYGYEHLHSKLAVRYS